MEAVVRSDDAEALRDDAVTPTACCRLHYWTIAQFEVKESNQVLAEAGTGRHPIWLVITSFLAARTPSCRAAFLQNASLTDAASRAGVDHFTEPEKKISSVS